MTDNKQDELTNLYKCPNCGKVVSRTSNKKYINSICDETGKDVKLKLFGRTTTNATKSCYVSVDWKEMHREELKELLAQQRQQFVKRVEEMPDLEKVVDITPDGSKITTGTGLVRKTDVLELLSKGEQK